SCQSLQKRPLQGKWLARRHSKSAHAVCQNYQDQKIFSGSKFPWLPCSSGPRLPLPCWFRNLASISQVSANSSRERLSSGTAICCANRLHSSACLLYSAAMRTSPRHSHIDDP